MPQVKQSASGTIAVQLVSSSDGVTPITGKTGADVTATFWKANNTYTNQVGTGTLTEGSTSAFASLGVYQLTVPSSATGVLGQLIVAVSCTGARTYKSELLDVVANLESDTYTLAGTLATASSLTTVGSNVTSIKAKTDNLPSDPADESLLEAAIAAISVTVDLTPVLTAIDEIDCGSGVISSGRRR